MKMKRCSVLCFVLVFCGMSTVFCLAEPSYRVTVGSEFTIDADDIGVVSLIGKTKVFVYAGKKIKNIKAKTSADTGSINCTWNHTLTPGLYSMYIETVNDNGEKETIKVTDFLAVVSPRIHKISSTSASAGDSLTIEGSFFSSRCQILMGETEETMKKCQIRTNKKEIMEPETGKSSAEIIVPRTVSSVDGAIIRVVSPIGNDTETVDSDLVDSYATAYVLSVGDIHETSKYLAKVSSFISTFKSTQKKLTIALNAGDQLSAYSRKSYDPDWARDLYTDDTSVHGVAMMEALSKTAYDVVTIGNHDQCLGYERWYELLQSYPSTVISANLFRYANNQLTVWTSPEYTSSPNYLSFALKGLDVGVVAVSSTYEDHWSDADKSSYRVVGTMNECSIDNIRACALFNDIVVLITHQNDVSDIIPVYGTPTPRGSYIEDCDIYTLKDLQNVALMVGGHEHKNYFRRASYTGDNDTYGLYTNPIYNTDSKLVMVKSSKFYGEYVGVVKILWEKSNETVSSIKLVEGIKGEDGNYLGCAADQMSEVEDEGLFQELDDSPWDPTVSTHWWRMDDWPDSDENISRIIKKHKQ